ncbi:MAG: phosphate ABC transporter permease PstA [Candidatus Riflebacteria bacterium]|nr:phosphate ABC transporter permease PstA [Candidatus Riflebacteria bacterium]
MNLNTRKLLDKSFSALGLILSAALLMMIIIILYPIFSLGIGAFIFKGTIEFRRVQNELFRRENSESIKQEINDQKHALLPLFDAMKAFEKELSEMPASKKREYKSAYSDFQTSLRELIGVLPGESIPELPRCRYGTTRWDKASEKLNNILFVEEYDYSNPTKMGHKILKPRADLFSGTALSFAFPFLKKNFNEIMRPEIVFYWRFLTDSSKDSHFFGGIGPEVTGTILLTVGAMLIAVPIGILSAIYLTEYARQNWLTSLLRTLISTLSGVPSIVFGLFGLAFFINTMKISESKSVFAGSLTLGLLILPVIIRASEEAILAVPKTYREAALSLGASPWKMIVSVVLPAALPGILTGIIISMGRAAGETAPIIFTAAVSLGEAPGLMDVFSQPTPALSWNIYNLATEHQKVDQIRHVQYGMVFTLIMIVLVMNCIAIFLRNRAFNKMKG